MSLSAASRNVSKSNWACIDSISHNNGAKIYKTSA